MELDFAKFHFALKNSLLIFAVFFAFNSTGRRAMEPFVHLNVHSCYSMLDGASSPPDLAEAAAKFGMPVLALTDTDGLYAAVPFVRACEGLGIRPVLGVDLTDPDSVTAGLCRRRAVLLARDAEGYGRCAGL